ncbi:MAG TPA: AsmA-like C-terminal domain-containing protein [Micropepsaceae bacterium]|nr:AsmA-like C-terminal domain-containing protein [Micropepsaceae bacterium]
MLPRPVQRTLLIFGALLAAVLFFLGGAALRLLMGPISLGPFASVIEDALNHSVSGVVIRFDQAVLEWSRAEGKVNLIVLGTKVFDLDGHIVAQAPKADLDFDAAALVAGHLNLKRFGLIGVQLTGVRTKDGAFRLGFGRDQSDANLLDTIRKILENSADGGGSLDSFSIRNARLAFHDEPTGLFIISPDASFTLKNSRKVLDASLESSFEIGGVSAHMAAHAVLRPDGSPDHGTLEIKGLSLPALAQNSTSFVALKPYRLTSDVEASFSLDEHGGLIASAFQITGTGSIETPLFKQPLLLKKFAATGGYDAPHDQLTLDNIRIDGKQASVNGKADVTFGWKDGGVETLSANVDADALRIELPDLLAQPLSLSHVSMQAGYDRQTRTITWRRAVIKDGTLSADVSGAARFADSGAPAIALNGELDALAVADALKYWPNGVAEGAREWIAANIPEGRVGPIRINADLPVGAFDASQLPDESLDVTFPFEGLTARYIARMTPMTGAHGEARLTGDTFHVAVAAASVGPLALTNGEVTIPDLHTTGVLTRVKAHSEGTMSQVLQLIDEEPLGYPKRFGINPTTVAGRASVDLDFEFPLLKDLALDQLRIGVQAKATDLALPLDNRKLDHGTVAFAIDSKSLTSQGTVNINNVPASFKWTEDFGGAGITTRIDLAGKIDDAARANLGLSEPKWLTGIMPTTLALTGRRFHFDEAAVKADLTNAAAEIPALNLAKRAGVAASATAQLRFGDKGAITVNDLAVASGGLNAHGQLSFDGDGRIINISLADLRSGLNDFAINIEPLTGGAFAYRIEGKSLDATHFVGDKKKATNGPPPPEVDEELINPFSLSARVDRLALRENRDFHDVTLALSFGAREKLTGFNLDAMGTGKGRVTGKMETIKGVRNLSLDTDDAGAFIETFLGFSSIRGGVLAARINFPGDAPGPVNVKPPAAPPDYQGTVTLTNIVVTDQPFVARLFSAGSLDGPLRLLQGEGIALSTASMPFSARGKLVTIHDGRAAGSAIGMTYAGMVDRKAEHVDLTGSLVPLYGLNSLLGSVPILGDLLVSKKGEGIFGLTYAMKGNLNEPGITVNPLSVLTPGIFRRIFEFSPAKEPTEQPQASAEPAPEAAPATPQ